MPTRLINISHIARHCDKESSHGIKNKIRLIASSRKKIIVPLKMGTKTMCEKNIEHFDLMQVKKAAEGLTDLRHTTKYPWKDIRKLINLMIKDFKQYGMKIPDTSDTNEVRVPEVDVIKGIKIREKRVKLRKFRQRRFVDQFKNREWE